MTHNEAMNELRALRDEQGTDGHEGHWFCRTNKQREALDRAITLLESLDQGKTECATRQDAL